MIIATCKYCGHEIYIPEGWALDPATRKTICPKCGKEQ